MYVFMVLSFAGFLCCWCIREPSISCSCSQCKDNTPVYLRHIWHKVQLVHGKSALLLTKHYFCLAQVISDNTSHIFFVKTVMVLFTFNWPAGFCNQRSKDGTVVRALASHQCGPSSNPGIDAICGLSLLLVLSLAPRGFSPGTPVFPSPQKPTFSNSNSTRNQVDEEPLRGCATCKSLFIYLYSNKRLCRLPPPSLSNITVLPFSM